MNHSTSGRARTVMRDNVAFTACDTMFGCIALKVGDGRRNSAVAD